MCRRLEFLIGWKVPTGALQTGSRVGPTDFGMGGALYPPIGGGHMGGDKGPMGGDSRVNRDKIGSPLK